MIWRCWDLLFDAPLGLWNCYWLPGATRSFMDGPGSVATLVEPPADATDWMRALVPALAAFVGMLLVGVASTR